MTALAEAATVAPTSRTMLWTGRVLSGLFVAFMLFDGAIKLTTLDVVVETNRQLGFSDGVIAPIGVIELALTLLYLNRRTAVFAAVLLMSVFGGAIATHLRLGNPLFSHVLFGVYLGVLMWGGLWLRDPQLREIFPVRR